MPDESVGSVDPDDVSRWIEPVRRHLRLGQIEQARTSLSAAEVAAPASPLVTEWSHCVESARLQTSGCLDQAAKVIDEGLQAFPESAPLLVQRSYLHLKRQDFCAVYEDARAARQLKEDYDVACALEVASLRMQLRFDEALAVVGAALARDRENAVLIFERGMVYFDLGFPGRAISDFVVAEKEAYERASEWRCVAEADELRLAKNYAKAQERAAKAMERFGGSVHLRNQLGLIHYDAAQFDAARQTFEKALAVESKSDFAAGWRFIAASAHCRSAQDREQAQALIESHPKLPKNELVLTETGYLLLFLGRVRDATQAFTEAAAAAPDFGPAHVGLGIALAQRAATRAKAEEEFRLAMELEAGRDQPVSVAVHLARLLNEDGRPDEALSVIDGASDGSVEALTVRAAVATALADKYHDDDYRRSAVVDVDLALRRVTPATSKDEKAYALLLRGNAYAMLGERGKARADLRACLDLKPPSRVALVAERNLLHLRGDRTDTLPRWLPHFLLTLLTALMIYVVVLLERGKISAVEALPVVIGLLLLIVAAFTLPVVTKLKFGGVELEKAASVIAAAPRLEAPTQIPLLVAGWGFLHHERPWRTTPGPSATSSDDAP